MILSVVIVNYNVKYFLEQCLHTVLQASAGIDAEVIVVDNASADDSIAYLRPKFPTAIFIANEMNTGFSRANNQALKLARGKFVLFLNPDTVVPVDCFTKCISFMDAHPDAGAIGVHMVNGEGRFLKESKRGFPSPSVSFWKMTGITSMYSRSKRFAKYYLGHLPENKTNEVEVLSGAFMFVRKEVLDITGGFDEQFFMYAEDIDLSYRIIKAGYKNYYYADTTIVHYKGESTKKDFKYVKLFYKSMSQFVKKYYGRGIYSTLLDLAIWSRAALALVIPKKKKSKTNPTNASFPPASSSS